MAHLTKQDCCKIENFLVAGYKPKEIARNLGKSHTTITREIPRPRQEEESERRKSRNFCVFRAKCKTKQSSVEEALIEMYLAGVSVRRVEDITEALWGTKVSPSTVSDLNLS